MKRMNIRDLRNDAWADDLKLIAVDTDTTMIAIAVYPTKPHAKPDDSDYVYAANNTLWTQGTFTAKNDSPDFTVVDVRSLPDLRLIKEFKIPVECGNGKSLSFSKTSVVVLTTSGDVLVYNVNEEAYVEPVIDS